MDKLACFNGTSVFVKIDGTLASCVSCLCKPLAVIKLYQIWHLHFVSSKYYDVEAFRNTSLSRNKMPHKSRPMTALLCFTGVNIVLVSTITPVYDFVCYHPYWERRTLEQNGNSPVLFLSNLYGKFCGLVYLNCNWVGSDMRGEKPFLLMYNILRKSLKNNWTSRGRVRSEKGGSKTAKTVGAVSKNHGHSRGTTWAVPINCRHGRVTAEGSYGEGTDRAVQLGWNMKGPSKLPLLG
ncbi:hypothetical protein RJ641_025563 [Dillenia turbinata]|uniref:Uncharacterized protein n=1 Tax=Dillenia turbinata TaxID=194707 RepID=A0AAN8ZNP0_9MAGN